MKPKKLFTLTAALLLCSGCSSSKTIEDEPYAAVPYNIFPAPTDAYVGDTMPFVTEDNTLELYYLYDTDHNGQAYHPIHKYSTANLYEYKDHEEVLPFGLMSDPDPAIGTGSVLQDKDGLYHLFYTGHNDIGNGGLGKECIMHATSSDRENWEKHPEDTFYAPEDYSKDDFRDPEVFWVEEENCYWMLVAARDKVRGGIVAKYTSSDLKEWNLDDPLFSPMEQYMLECPDLFKIGDTWYLTYSWDCVTYYAIGESLNGPFTAPRDNVLDGNGFIFYAAKTAKIKDNTYLCGWIGRAGLTEDSAIYQWAGNVLNHELVQHEDKTLGVKVPSTLASYFTKEIPFRAVKKAGDAKIDEKNHNISLKAEENTYALADMGTRPATMTFECDVTFDEGGIVGFAFGGQEENETYYALCLDAENDLLHYEGLELNEIRTWDAAAYTKFDFSKNETHHVKLVCENEIVVLYVDDTKALSSRIKYSIEGAHIGVFSDGCAATFSDIKMMVPEDNK